MFFFLAYCKGLAVEYLTRQISEWACFQLDLHGKHVYSRDTAPNSTRFEAILSTLLNGKAVSYSSGLSAYHAALVKCTLFENVARMKITARRTNAHMAGLPQSQTDQYRQCLSWLSRRGLAAPETFRGEEAISGLS